MTGEWWITSNGEVFQLEELAPENLLRSNLDTGLPVAALAAIHSKPLNLNIGQPMPVPAAVHL